MAAQMRNQPMGTDEAIPGAEEGADDKSAMLINTRENLKLTNDYTKRTKYAKTNLVNMSEFNNFDSVLLIFEEFVQQNTAFFYNFSEGEAFLEITSKVAEGQEVGQDLEELLSAMQQNFYAVTQQVEFDPNCKIFVPFNDNPLGFYLFEMNPLARCLNFYYIQEPENAEETQETMNIFINIVQNVFKCEDFNVNEILVEESTALVLNTFQDDPYVV